MKILFYVHALTSGGAERVLVTLANHFAERGDRIIISCDTNIKPVFPVSDKVILFNHRKGVGNSWFQKHFAPLRLLKTFVNMRNAVDIYKPDVAISFLTTFNIYTIISLMGKKVPKVLCEHTTVTYKPIFRERIFRDLLYKFSSAITVLTSYDFNIWKIKYKQVVIMPNPCETLSLGKASRLDKQKTIIAVGRVTDWHLKGFDNLLKSWCSICKYYPEWKLQIAGTTDEQSLIYLNDIIKKYNGERVEFLGYRSDIYELMARSEIFVLTSRREGLPMALIEAMSVNCCCVSFDVITGPSDIITDNQDGLLVKNQDVDDMIAKLRMVLSDDDLRIRLQSNASQAVKKFEVDSILCEWDNLFKSII